MTKVEEREYYNNLLEIYGDLLSAKQRSMLFDDLCLDLSISELADNYGISRAAVNDAIQKGKAKLESYEKKLQLYEKHVKSDEIIAKLKSNTTDHRTRQLLDELEGLN